jgi:hypothetical protein
VAFPRPAKQPAGNAFTPETTPLILGNKQRIAKTSEFAEVESIASRLFTASSELQNRAELMIGIKNAIGKRGIRTLD